MAENNCTHDCSSCGEDCAQRSAIEKEKPHDMSRISHVIGVVSGKGR